MASHHTSLAALLRDAEFKQFARDPGALVELRFDNYVDAEPAGVTRALSHFGPSRCVVTCRLAEEGGGGKVAEAQRLAYLDLGAQGGAAYVDVELATLQAYGCDARRFAVGGTQVVVSAHDFAGVPALASLRRTREAAEALGAHLVKLAASPATYHDGWPLLQLLGENAPWTRPLLGLAMGEAGLWSRLLGPRFAKPAPFTFARAEGALGTAPGQPSWRALQSLYRFAQQTPQMPLYGVIGSPIAHSQSPQVHNAALQALGLPGMYLPWRIDGDPLPFLRLWAPALGIAGLSVTLPHKEAALAACRSLSPLARSIGAVNTLSQPQSDGSWVGDNTDAAAAAQCLEHGLGRPLQGQRVLVLGAGGVAKAVAHAAQHAGAQVLVANRTPERAHALAAAVGGQVVQPTALPADIAAVVNGTSLGMHPQVTASPLQPDQIPAGALVFDTIYAPAQTQLLQWAAARGCHIVGGAEMFLQQAAAQVALFTGQPAPLQAMRAAFT